MRSGVVVRKKHENIPRNFILNKVDTQKRNQRSFIFRRSEKGLYKYR